MGGGKVQGLGGQGVGRRGMRRAREVEALMSKVRGKDGREGGEGKDAERR